MQWQQIVVICGSKVWNLKWGAYCGSKAEMKIKARMDLMTARLRVSKPVATKKLTDEDRPLG